ncbi:MAG: hypothetical protein AAFZ15_08665 [Bacteroidota bacterium]
MKSFSFFIVLTLSLVQWSCTPSAEQDQQPFLDEQAISEITWVAYAPTIFDPYAGIQPTPESITQDLKVLAKAGFTGLITYGCDGVLGKELPQIAEKLGFAGLILGIWNLNSAEEIANAQKAAKSNLVKGYCVGNEGLGGVYGMNELRAAIDTVRTLTGKPVTTTEQVEDYADENLLGLGDWIFPNVHPYWHEQYDNEAAVKWTVEMYDDLKKRSGKMVLLKEVGFPTAGDDAHHLSEEKQKEYYVALSSRPCQFAWFEAFDMTWKTHEPVEPYWGLFKADRSPKQVTEYLISKNEK